MRTAAALLALVVAASGRSGPAPDSGEAFQTFLPRVEATGDPCAAPAASAPGRVFWIDGSHPGARDDGAGTPDQPWATVAAVSRRGLQPDDTVIIRPGLYRGSLTPRQPGLIITGCPGAEPVISGADSLVARWGQVHGYWIAEGYRPFDRFGERYDANLVILDGSPLRPVADPAVLEPGTFTVFDDGFGQRRLAVMTGDSVAPRVEVGTRDVLFSQQRNAACRDHPSDRPGPRLRHLVFRHAANPAQTGAVCISGSGAEVEDLRVAATGGRGVEVWGSDHQIRRVDSSNNGHLGMGGGCTGCLVEDVVASRNNWRGHDPFWEAGGGKWVRTSRTIFRRFRARDNDGPGLWLDGDSPDNVIEEALLEGNRVSGLQLELGSDNNRVVRSRITGTRWDGWSASGILIMAASGSILEENEICGNLGSGLWLRMDSRRPTGGLSARDNLFCDNAPESEDKDYQVRIEIDAAEGAAPPEFHWEGNRIETVRVDHQAGIRAHRDAPVRHLTAGELARSLGRGR